MLPEITQIEQAALALQEQLLQSLLDKQITRKEKVILAKNTGLMWQYIAEKINDRDLLRSKVKYLNLAASEAYLVIMERNDLGLAFVEDYVKLVCYCLCVNYSLDQTASIKKLNEQLQNALNLLSSLKVDQQKYSAVLLEVYRCFQGNDLPRMDYYYALHNFLSKSSELSKDLNRFNVSLLKKIDLNKNHPLIDLIIKYEMFFQVPGNRLPVEEKQVMPVAPKTQIFHACEAVTPNLKPYKRRGCLNI